MSFVKGFPRQVLAGGFEARLGLGQIAIRGVPVAYPRGPHSSPPPLSECDAALPCSLNARVRFVSPYCLLSVSRGALSRRSRGDGAPSWPPSAPQGQLPGLCVSRVRTARLPLPRPRPVARFPTTCRRGRS